jgi:hypothetical protein
MPGATLGKGKDLSSIQHQRLLVHKVIVKYVPANQQLLMRLLWSVGAAVEDPGSLRWPSAKEGWRPRWALEDFKPGTIDSIPFASFRRYGRVFQGSSKLATRRIPPNSNEIESTNGDTSFKPRRFWSRRFCLVCKKVSIYETP